jgi:hypothetical protein
MTKAAGKPESFSIRERDIRRANLRRFPYHFLFRIVGHEVRNSRRPSSPSTSIFWIQASIGVWPSWKSVAWSGLGFQSRHQVVGVEILNLSKRFGKMSKRWLCLGGLCGKAILLINGEFRAEITRCSKCDHLLHDGSVRLDFMIDDVNEAEEMRIQTLASDCVAEIRNSNESGWVALRGGCW